ncbi:MAG: pyruvate kinase [Actinomycetota bacterium]
MKATKLVCTIGPASVTRLKELVEAGMDVARINCSHGSRGDQNRNVEAVRKAADEVGRPVGILADLSGPKVRLGELGGGVVKLESGARFVLRADSLEPGDENSASTTYEGLAADLEPEDKVLLADGAVALRVLETKQGDVITEVVRGGTIRSRAGVNAPSERLGLPAITPKDEKDLAWALEIGADMVAQSFVRTARDCGALLSLMPEKRPLLIAKIETSSAVAEAPAILQRADAIMVARGDLGVEASIEEIPVIQKKLVDQARAAAVPVIIATQMLESMTAAPRPTRAEASDVAGAVFEGADAILLSAETAIGKYPVEAAQTGTRILEVAETAGEPYVFRRRHEDHPELEEAPLAQAAAVLARQGGAKAVACFTHSGLTARLVSAARPGVPIHAFSPEPATVGQLTLIHGVEPRSIEAPEDLDGMIASMEARLMEVGSVSDGDSVVMVASSPAGQAHANLLKVHRVGA